MRFRLKYFVPVIFSVVTVLLGSAAFAKNLGVLTRLLIPAYIAQDFAVLCGTQNPDFLSESEYGTAWISAFAEHVKNEVTVDVPENEAAIIRITAANAAQLVARREMQILTKRQIGDPNGSLRRWCNGSAKSFILEITNRHREEHLEFDRIVKRAKGYD